MPPGWLALQGRRIVAELSAIQLLSRVDGGDGFGRLQFLADHPSLFGLVADNRVENRDTGYHDRNLK